MLPVNLLFSSLFLNFLVTALVKACRSHDYLGVQTFALSFQPLCFSIISKNAVAETSILLADSREQQHEYLLV